MAMAVDNRQQPAPFQTMGYDPLRYASQTQFTNPWVSAPATSQSQLYATAMPATSLPASGMGNDTQRGYSTAHIPAVSAAGYSGAPMGVSSAALASDMSRSYANFSSPSANTSTFVPTTQYTSTPYGYQTTHNRRPSHPSVMDTSSPAASSGLGAASTNSYINSWNRLTSATDAERQHFSDAMDASRGMLAMSQAHDDITPRGNIYGHSNSSRSSTDSYGFPSTHSSHSSISSASTYPSYYNSSAASEASIGDYSSASESVDMPTSRTLPRPNGLLGGGSMPPAPQSMMGQFSSKVSSSSQKKHKCKICDKRFTRPSSLQTHMYSHTGEKPFACDIDGCGRHFSVVSNLRRHKKVHKGEGYDHPSPDDDEE